MSSDKAPNITVKKERPSLTEHMLRTGRLMAFPLVAVQLKPSKVEDHIIELRVSPKIYEYFKNTSSSEQIFLYLSITHNTVGFWTTDMMTSFKVLSELGIIDDIKSWIAVARGSIVNVLAKAKVESKKSNPKALKVSEELLKSLDLLEKVKAQTLLPLVVKDIINSKTMDPTTVIYRVAMAIFHAKTLSDETVFDEIEDPSNLYFKLIESEFYKNHKKAFASLEELSVEMRNPAVKGTVSFAIAAYVYHTHL